MTNRRKLTIVVLGAGAATLVVGLGTAGAIVAARAVSPSDESKAIIDDAASQLGVEPAALSAALKKALKDRIDAAVAAGRLTEEQATRLKERIDADEYPLLFGPGGHRGPGFGFGHMGPFQLFPTAASYLGVTEAELEQELSDKTLAEIAKEKGKSASGLVQALVAEAKKGIDQAVSDGRLTQQQATELEAELQQRIQAFVNGEQGEHGFGFHGFRYGSSTPRAPPMWGGPSA